MRFICFLILISSTNLFAGGRELPVGTFPGLTFSLEKKGATIFSNKEVHYHRSTLQIRKISSYIYEFTVAVYLQETPVSKALSETRVDRYTVIWKSEAMGTLINEKKQYNKERSEFLLLPTNFTIKSLVSASGIVETQTYRIE
tara:strand:- start:432 stop:860 length:429 start_codon:yes stop_codon:yes gene_type:complete